MTAKNLVYWGFQKSKSYLGFSFIFPFPQKVWGKSVKNLYLAESFLASCSNLPLSLWQGMWWWERQPMARSPWRCWVPLLPQGWGWGQGPLALSLESWGPCRNLGTRSSPADPLEMSLSARPPCNGKHLSFPHPHGFPTPSVYTQRLSPSFN